MTSVPGVDLPEEQTEAEVALPGGVSVSTRVEFVGDGVIVVRPSLGEYGDQAVASAGARAEVIWKGPEGQRSRPASVLSVEQGAVVRWRLEPTGPAEDSQRRQAVRARVELPLAVRYQGVDLPGNTVDVSEAGVRCQVEGFGLPPGQRLGARSEARARGRRADRPGRGRPDPAAGLAVADVHPLHRHRREGPGPAAPPGVPGAARGAGSGSRLTGGG